MRASSDSTGNVYTERLTAAIANAFAASRTADCVETSRRSVEHSVLYRALQTAFVYRTLCAAFVWLEKTLERWIKHSFGYRWLTADPDPNVIVIDLRETKTVGPPLRLLERVLFVAIPAVSSSFVWRLSKAAIERLRAGPLRIAGSGLLAVVFVSSLWTVVTGASSFRVGALIALAIVGLAAFLDRRSWAQLRKTRVVAVLAAIFVPPEPPTKTERIKQTERTEKTERAARTERTTRATRREETETTVDGVSERDHE